MNGTCPLCTSVVPSASLESHLRSELLYAAFQCGLCQTQFFTRELCLYHFEGPFSPHPRGTRPKILENPDKDMDRRLVELIRQETEANEARHLLKSQSEVKCSRDETFEAKPMSFSSSSELEIGTATTDFEYPLASLLDDDEDCLGFVAQTDTSYDSSHSLKLKCDPSNASATEEYIDFDETHNLSFTEIKPCKKKARIEKNTSELSFTAATIVDENVSTNSKADANKSQMYGGLDPFLYKTYMAYLRKDNKKSPFSNFRGGTPNEMRIKKQAISHRCRSFLVDSGKLYYYLKGSVSKKVISGERIQHMRKVVRLGEAEAVLAAVHMDNDHCGILRMYEALIMTHWWPKMMQAITLFRKSCEFCAHTRKGTLPFNEQTPKNAGDSSQIPISSIPISKPYKSYYPDS